MVQHMICPCSRTASVSAKCDDRVCIYHNNKEFNELKFEFGIGKGDYIDFKYCMDCGKILGTSFPRPTIKETGECPDCGCLERTKVASGMHYNSYCDECGLLFS